MTRKNYRAMALWFASQQSNFVSEKVFHQAVISFTAILKDDNPNFSFAMFTDAVLKLAQEQSAQSKVQLNDLGDCDVPFCFCDRTGL